MFNMFPTCSCRFRGIVPENIEKYWAMLGVLFEDAARSAEAYVNRCGC